MKRIISIILAIIISSSSVLVLSSCGATEKKDALQMGQWLSLVADSFGMQNYVDDTPYFENVKSDNDYFSVFQMAAEWEVIDASEKISDSTPVRWKDVLISLVNAGAFLEDDATEDEKIEFAISNFDKNIRTYWGNRYITLEEALPLLNVAQEMWAKKTYKSNVEKAKFSDEVKNYIEEDSIEYSIDDNMIISASEKLFDLKVGDVYTLPAANGEPASINKVKEVTVQNGEVRIVNDDTFNDEEAGEYIEEVKIQQTSAPDFTQIAGIYDENGNPINYTIESDNSNSTSSLNYIIGESDINLLESGSDVQKTGIFDSLKGSLKFEVSGFEVSLSLTKDDVSVKLSKEISDSGSLYRKEKKEVYGEVAFKDVVITRDIDYSWGKLHSATIKLDYKTVMSFGIKAEREGDIGKLTEEDKNSTMSISSIVNQYKDRLLDMKKDVNNSKYKEKDLYICRLTIVEGWAASIDFIIKGKITAEGELRLSFEIEGAQGIEYKDGKIRYIKSKDVDCDFAAEGSIEATIAPGLAITILKKIAVIEITLDAGLGAKVGMTAHLFDKEGHEIYSGKAQLTSDDADALSDEKQYTTAEEIKKFAIENGGDWNGYQAGESVELVKGVCLEWSLYPILRINAGGNSLVGKLLSKLKISASLEVLGSDDTILSGHIDFPNVLSKMMETNSMGGALTTLLGIGAECIYDYKPWDEAVEELDKDEEWNEDNDDILSSDVITLSTMRVFIVEGETEQIRVTGLPQGYELSDLVVEIEDESVATFDIKEGLITGIKEGLTNVIVKTNDNKYEAHCAISVVTEEIQNMEDSINWVW